MISTHAMDKRQLTAISICFGLIYFEATITLGVMPVYIVRLGADPATTGIFLAFQFFCVTIGNMAGGWLTDRLGQRKRITLISYLLWIPAALLMTQARTVGEVILTTGLIWLPGGVAVSALNSILGLSAGESERGRVFGWVAFTNGIGGLIAGLIGGPIAERWSFPILFVMMASLVGIMFFITLSIRDVDATPVTLQKQNEVGAPAVTQAGVGSLVYMLLIANLFVRLGPSASDLGRPLVMLQLKMDATAVSNAIAFSAAVTLPLPLLMGWLSDRIGRRRLLILFYGIGALGVLLLVVAGVAWHFWFSATLVSILNASNGVGQAYIADLSDPKAIGRSLSLFSSSNFIANMIGLGSAGYVMQAIGINPTLLLGASFMIIGLNILLRMRLPAPKLASIVS